MQIDSGFIFKGDGDGLAKGTFLNRAARDLRFYFGEDAVVTALVIWNDSEYDFEVALSGHILSPKR